MIHSFKGKSGSKCSISNNSPAVRAARKFNAAISECYWDGSEREVALDVKDPGLLRGKGAEPLAEARPDDIALVLHTR